MLSKSLSKRCSALCALPSQTQKNHFSSVSPSIKLNKVTEACLIAVLSSAITCGWGRAYSADLPADGNLGTTAYKEPSYTITNDL